MTPFAARSFAVFAAAGAAWAAVSAFAAPVPPEVLPALSPSAGRSYTVTTAKVMGNITCAAASCHGATVPKGTPGGEHGTWSDGDPHRKAYGVLFQDRSKRMVKLLAEGKTHAPAHETELCLKCHGASPANVSEMVAAKDELHQNGGSCENCHGAAEKYLTVHYTGPFKGLSAQEKASQYGLMPTKDLAFRSQICAGCHTGEPGREVDHKLIAAGHPALRFELAAYHSEPLYSKHWQEKTYGRDVEAWMWMIGQVGVARASVTLTNHRAAGAENRDWPEFAEYSCFACHKDLTPGTTAATANVKPRLPGTAPQPGTLPWNSWSFPLALDLAKQGDASWTAPATRPNAAFDLAELFRKNDRPKPASARAASSASAIDLDRWLNDLQMTAERRSHSDPLKPAELKAALAHVLRFGETVLDTGAQGSDWDRHAQGFLGAAALYRGLVAVDPPSRSVPVEEQLRSLSDDLLFPQGRDGPRRWTPEQEASFRERWKKLQVSIPR